MKKMILAVLVIMATAAIFFALQDRDSSKENKVARTYSKKMTGVLEYNTTKKELKQAKIQVESKELAPSKRELFPKNAQVDLNQLEYSNSISKDWKTKLSKELLRYQKLDTKVVIKPHKSLIILKDKKGLHVEEVIISFINKSGLMNGFSALVDSESGKILKTWNRTTWLIKNKNSIQYQGELR